MFDWVAQGRRVVLADIVLEAAGHLAAVLVLVLGPHIVAGHGFRCMQEERHSESTSPTLLHHGQRPSVGARVPPYLREIGVSVEVGLSCLLDYFYGKQL